MQIFIDNFWLLLRLIFPPYIILKERYDKCSLSTIIIPLRQERPRPSTSVGPGKAKSQRSVPEKSIVTGVQYKSECQYLVGAGHCPCFNTGDHPQVLTTHKAAIKCSLLPDFQSSYHNSAGFSSSMKRTTFMSNVQKHLWEEKMKRLTCASSAMCFKAQSVIYFQQNL